MLIAIEGIDGSGKSTLIEGLKKHYGTEFEFVKDPGGYSEDSLSMKIRTLLMNSPNISPECQALLFNAARLDTLQNLKSDKVIFDRYVYSTLAYQYAGLGGSFETIYSTIDSVIQHSTKFRLDLMIYLEIDIDDAVKRLYSRGIENGKHFEKIEVLEKAQKFFDECLYNYSNNPSDFFTNGIKNVKAINALLSPEEILQLAIKAIEDVL